MTRCNYWDCGWCYAPEEVETSAEKSSACESPQNCPYLNSIMTNYPTERFYNHENKAPDSSSERPRRFKPQPPGPRLIREDFLPNKMDNILEKYRIQKTPFRNLSTGEKNFTYVVEEKRWFGWKKLGFNGDIISYFYSYAAANKALYDHIRDMNYEKLIEYLPPDFSVIDTEPNPPPSNP